MSALNHPHRRYNALSGDWILVSPHRTQRPWQGKHENTAAEVRPRYDPTCYLCPGNTRAGGERNPNYAETFVFTNDFPALLPDDSAEERSASNKMASEKGIRAPGLRGLRKIGTVPGHFVRRSKYGCEGCSFSTTERGGNMSRGLFFAAARHDVAENVASKFSRSSISGRRKARS